jgi:hypothetical protein
MMLLIVVAMYHDASYRGCFLGLFWDAQAGYAILPSHSRPHGAWAERKGCHGQQLRVAWLELWAWKQGKGPETVAIL